MLLKVDIKAKIAERIRGVKLNTFSLDELKFQNILYNSLDKLIHDDELLLIMQSRKGPEEPDLMAIDKNGILYIFELKIWESKSENILQVLRYGQIFGSKQYDDLNRIFSKHDKGNRSLKEAYKSTFDEELAEDKFNNAQVFVVMTNGIDCKTREAIQYWRQQGLDVRPWIYRVYEDINSEMLLEISIFTSIDNPYEDISEGYNILNTNSGNCLDDHHSMLSENIAAAYFTPWKNNITNLSKGDVVFLFQNKVGIVAVGKASGKLQIRNYHNSAKYLDEEYFMNLNKFHLLNSPIPTPEIKSITGKNYRFMRTLFGIDAENGRKLFNEAMSR